MVRFILKIGTLNLCMMPEEMPTPKKILKELEREKRQLENNEKKKFEEIK